jgi:hypothetical protein
MRGLIDGLVSQPFMFMNSGSSHLDFSDVFTTLPVVKLAQFVPLPRGG